MGEKWNNKKMTAKEKDGGRKKMFKNIKKKFKNILKIRKEDNPRREKKERKVLLKEKKEEARK